MTTGAGSEIHGRYSIGVEVLIAVPPIRVWKALLEPEDMNQWFSEYAETELRPDGLFRFGGRYTYRIDGPESDGQALVGIETGRSVRYNWDVGGLPTRVRFMLSSVRGDCRLRVIQECDGEPRADWRGNVADHLPWENYLLNLKMHLERGNPGIRVDYDNLPEDRHVISGEIRCASERIWRVLTDRDELSRRAGVQVDFDPDAGQGWTQPFGRVAVTEMDSGRELIQRWRDDSGRTVWIQWNLVSKGVSSTVELTTWGEDGAEMWHRGRQGLWMYLNWCRIFNQLKYYSETGSLTGLRRLSGDF